MGKLLLIFHPVKVRRLSWQIDPTNVEPAISAVSRIFYQLQQRFALCMFLLRIVYYVDDFCYGKYRISFRSRRPRYRNSNS